MKLKFHLTQGKNNYSISLDKRKVTQKSSQKKIKIFKVFLKIDAIQSSIDIEIILSSLIQKLLP